MRRRFAFWLRLPHQETKNCCRWTGDSPKQSERQRRRQRKGHVDPISCSVEEYVSRAIAYNVAVLETSNTSIGRSERRQSKLVLNPESVISVATIICISEWTSNRTAEFRIGLFVSCKKEGRANEAKHSQSSKHFPAAQNFKQIVSINGRS